MASNTLKDEAWGELSPDDTSIRNYSTEELNSILVFKKMPITLDLYIFFRQLRAAQHCFLSMVAVNRTEDEGNT